MGRNIHLAELGVNIFCEVQLEHKGFVINSSK